MTAHDKNQNALNITTISCFCTLYTPLRLLSTSVTLSESGFLISLTCSACLRTMQSLRTGGSGFTRLVRAAPIFQTAATKGLLGRSGSVFYSQVAHEQHPSLRCTIPLSFSPAAVHVISCVTMNVGRITCCVSCMCGAGKAADPDPEESLSAEDIRKNTEKDKAKNKKSSSLYDQPKGQGRRRDNAKGPNRESAFKTEGQLQLCVFVVSQ